MSEHDSLNAMKDQPDILDRLRGPSGEFDLAFLEEAKARETLKPLLAAAIHEIECLREICRKAVKRANIAESAIAWANNSLYGSHGFFLSLTGGEPDEHHLDRGIENLKHDARTAQNALAEIAGHPPHTAPSKNPAGLAAYMLRKIRERDRTTPVLVDPARDIARLTDERDRATARAKIAEAAVAWANKSLYGTLAFSLSENGQDTDVRHLHNGIENWKQRARASECALGAIAQTRNWPVPGRGAAAYAQEQLEHIREKYGNIYASGETASAPVQDEKDDADDAQCINPADVHAIRNGLWRMEKFFKSAGFQTPWLDKARAMLQKMLGEIDHLRRHKP